MTELGDRLDELAGEALHDLELVHPATLGPSAATDRPPRRLALALVAVAAVVLLVIGAGLQRLVADPERVEVATVGDVTRRPGPLPALTRPPGADDVLPNALLADLGPERRTIDLDEVRAGPALGNAQVFVAPTADRRSVCVFLVDTGSTPEDWSATSGCQSIEWIQSRGVHHVASDGVVGGVTAGDVSGVLVQGVEVDIDGGVFISSVAEAAVTDIEPVWESTVAPAMEVCRRLEPVVAAASTVDVVDRADAVALVDALAVTGGISAFDDLARLLGPLPPGDLDLRELPPSAAANTITSAFETCRQVGAPGWAIVYVPPGHDDLSVPSTAGRSELDGLGRVQAMTEGDPTASIGPAGGSGLGLVTRFGLEGTELTVFLWSQLSGDQLVHCRGVEVPGASQWACDPDPFGPIERIETDAVGDTGEELVLYLWYHDQTASYALATTTGATSEDAAREGGTFVQRIQGRFSAFALPVGGATLSLHDADGAEVDSIVVG